MRAPTEILEKALDEGKILCFEPELIENLRTIKYYGLPLSIILLCKEFCRKECFQMAINISRGMNDYKIVLGDVNYFDINGKYPNHSWVEKDGFVYDTTDGIKWDKELYYSLFKPVIHASYTKETVKDYEYYNTVIEQSSITIPIAQLTLMIQHIELLEEEKPSGNKEALLNEINLWRKANNITKRFSSDEMEKFKKILSSL